MDLFLALSESPSVSIVAIEPVVVSQKAPEMSPALHQPTVLTRHSAAYTPPSVPGVCAAALHEIAWLR